MIDQSNRPLRSSRKNRPAALILATLLIAVLWLPLLQMMIKRTPDGNLYGYTPTVAQRPSDMLSAWFDRRLQRWTEAYVGAYIGFRSAFVRTYNQTAFDLFHGLPQLEVVEVPPGELVYRHHVMSLNDTVLKRDALQQQYLRRARRVWLTQQVLANNGSRLLMMIVPSKGGSYPEKVPRRFLARDPDILMSTGIRYGDVLANAGVDVMDLTREFRKLRPLSKYPLDAAYGVHWSFYAGCVAAQQLVNHLAAVSSKSLTTVECEPVSTETSRWTDIDGLSLLNLWRPDRYLVPMPYPTVHGVPRPNNEHPRVLFVGDSFSDQIRRALSLARVFDQVAFASYFKNLQQVGIDDEMNRNPAVAIDPATFDFTPDGKPFDLIVLEAVDYNLIYDEYGFPDAAFKRYLLRPNFGQTFDAGEGGTMKPMLISGWAKQTATGAPVASWPVTLAFLPPTDSRVKQMTVKLNASNASTALNVSVNGKATRIESHSTVPVSFTNTESSPGVQISLTLDLPALPPGADPIVLDISPKNPETGATVMLTGLRFE
jgi:hypothetical protein